MNLTYIVPVPKCTRAQISKNFRFISLYNVLYKIILKILVNKLKSIFLKIIDQQQSSFLPGRQITNNVILAMELFKIVINGFNKGML